MDLSENLACFLVGVKLKEFSGLVIYHRIAELNIEAVEVVDTALEIINFVLAFVQALKDVSYKVKCWQDVFEVVHAVR